MKLFQYAAFYNPPETDLELICANSAVIFKMQRVIANILIEICERLPEPKNG